MRSAFRTPAVDVTSKSPDFTISFAELDLLDHAVDLRLYATERWACTPDGH